jgi:hypothetical protein
MPNGTLLLSDVFFMKLPKRILCLGFRTTPAARDQCYNFLNIFARKNGEEYSDQITAVSGQQNKKP